MSTSPPPLGWRQTFAIFAGAAIVLLFVSEVVMPRLAAWSSVEPVLLWFLAAGLLLFPPILLAGWALLRAEGRQLQRDHWRERLRFRPMTRGDWGWTVGALVAIAGASGLLVAAWVKLWPDTPLAPWFLAMEPLVGSRLWILAAWLPFLLLTLFTEEVVWRGIVLPRQERALGRAAWLANGAGWLLFHLAFGPAILVSLLPIVTILPWVVQRRGNSWIGVAVHAVFNASGFLATAFGWI